MQTVKQKEETVFIDIFLYSLIIMHKIYGQQNGNCLYSDIFIQHIGFKNPNIKYYIYRNEIASEDIICDLG